MAYCINKKGLNGFIQMKEEKKSITKKPKLDESLFKLLACNGDTKHMLLYRMAQSDTGDWIMAGLDQQGKTTPIVMTRERAGFELKWRRFDGGKREHLWALRKKKVLWLITALFSRLAAYRFAALRGLSSLLVREHRGCPFTRVCSTDSDVYGHTNVTVGKLPRRVFSFFFLFNRNESTGLFFRTFPVTLPKLQRAVPLVRPHSSWGLAFVPSVRLSSCHNQPEERHGRCHIPAHVQPLFCKGASSS